MTKRTFFLRDPVQGHKVLSESVWQYCKALLVAGHQLELTVKFLKRTPAQNRRYWGRGILAQIAEKALGGKYSAEIWHEQFKRQFIGIIELPNGQIMGDSSADLDKKEFADFCDRVEAYAATDLGVVFEDLQEH